MMGYKISGYCVIRNFSIWVNHERCIQSSTTSLEEFLVAAYTQINMNYPRYYKMDSLSKVGILAAELLWRDAKIIRPDSPESIAVILSNAHASLDTDVRYWESAKKQASPALFVYTLPNIVTGEICIRHNLKGENAFFIAERFDPVLLSDYAGMVLDQPGTKLCMGGWLDVMNDHHDVFLYLMEKSEDGNSAEEIRATLNTIYQLDYGKINS
ncbi:MAG: hypothetical protein JNM57_13510 [Cyclobacteriaceae bacterium]|nr:hypothetical protein [Cyclobacteriaceae bacterium]